MNDHTRHYEQQPESSSDRNFGLIFSAFFVIVALLPLLYGYSMRFWAAGVSLAFGVIALAAPSTLAPLNRLWTKFGLLLHCIVSPIALGILFFGVVTPTGFLMRLFGKKPLQLQMDKAASSYWVIRTPPGPTAESFRNQF